MLHARHDYNQRIQDSAGLIPDTEPVFLLRGQDTLAPAMLRHYAFLCKIHEVDPQLTAMVLEHERAMRLWQRMVKSKIPDLPEAGGGG